MLEIRRGELNLSKEYETFIDFIDVSEKTIKNYKIGIGNFMEYLKKNNISNPTRNDIRNYRNNLIHDYCSNTVNSYMTAIREFFKYLSTYGIYENVVEGIKGAKTSLTPKKQILTKEQVGLIYNNLADKRERALFSLLITTGLRGIEVAESKIEDLKLHNGEVVLWVKCKGHDEKDEYVKIPTQVLNDLKEYIGERTEGYIFVGNGNNNRNNKLTTKTIRLLIKNIFKRFGIDSDNISLHSTRRTFATIAYENGVDIYSIQQVLHHRSIATTTIYLKSADRDKNNSEYKVADCLNAVN